MVTVEEVKVYLVMECGVFGRLKLHLSPSMFYYRDALNHIFSIADFIGDLSHPCLLRPHKLSTMRRLN